MREVDEAVRQDQVAEFGRRYGKPLIAVVALGILAFGGYLFWDHRQEAAMEAESETLVGALDQLQAGNLGSATERLDPLLAEEGGAATQAALLKAGIAMEQGRNEDAAKIYAEVAADDDVPQLLRDLATIREIAATFDDREPDDVVARLKPMAVPGNPYFGSAGELVAMAYLDQGNNEEAGTLLAAIAKDETQPESLRSRARQMAGVLGVDAIEDVDAVLEGIQEPAAAAQAQQ
ncbi:tetratricopeptide repeat protein [Pelagerythrobacter rhizovicinus]|uniref:Tetratricopeptide repeat protein n=2 Tax=Pelagerythrobacter rhizovicinus TaxID=2268576 RepID=A0A4Q2KMW5_9SPHN|nr:tetratricopeptide repeat protein [Pelagerythrobacter rhizovicinus]